MVFDINSLQNLGLPEMVIWLLSFAIIFGALGQAKLPKSASSRLIISLVLAFFVLFAAPANVVQVLSNFSSSIVLVLMALIVLMVFFEVFGVRIKKKVPVMHQGKKIDDAVHEYTVFESYGYLFFFAFVVIAALLFVNSGGLAALGLNINLSPYATTTTAFLIFILLAVVWMFAEKK